MQTAERLSNFVAHVECQHPQEDLYRYCKSTIESEVLYIAYKALVNGSSEILEDTRVIIRCTCNCIFLLPYTYSFTGRMIITPRGSGEPVVK